MTVGALSLTGCGVVATTGETAAPVSGSKSASAALSSSAEAALTPDVDAPAPDVDTAESADPAPEAEAALAAEAAATDAIVADTAPAGAAAGTTDEVSAAAGTAVTPAAPVVAAPAIPANPVAAARVPAASAPAADGTQAAATFGWGPVVAGDEFSNTGAPDSAKWSIFKGDGHHGKGTRSPAAWSVANGVATVTGDAKGNTGGMSAKFAQQKYGRWETRMKTNQRDSEYHPVLLLWPDKGGNTTTENEIDYAEGTGDPSKIGFYLHHGPAGSTTQTVVKKAIDTTQFHNYAVDWSPSGVRGYIDGVLWFEDTNPAHNPGQSMHQTLQLDWFPDGSGTTPSEMHVDWVRVYNHK